MTAVLVADDDAEIARFASVVLEREGFQVLVAYDGEEALALVGAVPPVIALVDLSMPTVDGLTVCRRLRADPTTASIPVIIMAASPRPSDRVRGLDAGADDFLVKPFDSLELVTRVRSTLRRNSEMRAVSPLTGLPGNQRISDEMAMRTAAREEFAVCYFDLDNFKAFNDRYGWVRGDEVISLVASALRTAGGEIGTPPPFVGHVGGDDFVAICEPERVEKFCERTLEIFDSRVKALHDPGDVRQGFLRIVDRQGVARQVPLISLSVGVAMTTKRQFSDPRALVAVATEMKAVAKSRAGSAIAIDRRSGPVDPDAAVAPAAGT